MASGLENRIGYGQAQILSQEGFQPMQFAEMYRQTKDRDEQKRLYEEQKKEQDEYKKIQIIGDALDPRNFNVHVHTRVKDAIGELAKRNRDEGMSLADTFLAAQQYAGKLGYMSDQFNQLQQQLAATRESYKPYKEINTNEISKLALSKALVEFDKNGGIDLTKNYFDEALNENPDAALIGGNGYVPDVVKDELVPYESEGQERDARGGGSIFKYKFDNVPAFYDVKTRGRFDAPEVTTRGQKINIGGQDVMMLDDIAWARYQVSPVNTLRLRKRLKEKYGSALTPQNEETLARIEAYNDVDRFKPQPRITDRQFEPRATNINITNNTQRDTERIDLTEYPDVSGGGKDITSLMQGIDVVSLISGDKFSASKVVYNPQTKRVVVTNPVDNKPEEMSLTTFTQNLKPQNPAAEIKWLKQGLLNAIVGGSQTPKPTNNTYIIGGRTLTQKQVESAAAKYKMSVSDYLKSVQ